MSKKEHLFKILVIGDAGTGKSSLIKRYVYNFYSQQYRATVGVDFALKIVQHDENTVVRLQLWDIAGQSRVGNLLRVYYKEAVGAFVVYDVTKPQTLEAARQWKTDLDSKVTLPNGTAIPCVLLGNKVDATKEGVCADQTYLDQFVEELKFTKAFETSAKENIGVKEAATFLINEVLQAVKEDGPPPSRDENVVDISKSETQTPSKRGCC